LHRIEIKLKGKLSRKVDVMPQQSYIRRLRADNGDNKNLKELSEYVKTLGYTEETGDSDLFAFGEELVRVDDDNHFHLGFTSKKLLSNISKFKSGCFHIDATYKIVKYAYPRSDSTSHELAC
jgi:hypothetical protein